MTAEPRRARPAIPAGVWALGFVSMFMDISSEMIHALLPVYLTVVLHASMTQVGLIEGLAEATASITKLASGALSDRWRNRKWLATLGYGLAALTKPVFPLAGSVGMITAARFADRVGKGLRGAPRDALVADLAPLEIRGAAFGLRQSLDTVGAFLGPAIAVALMLLSGDAYRVVFWAACVPAVISTLVIILAVREPAHTDGGAVPVGLFRLQALRDLGPAFWGVLALGIAFTLARFSEAFLVLRAHDLGVPPATLPLVLVAMNLVYAFSAYPAGVLSDRLNRRSMLAVGLAVLAAADLALGGGGLAGLVVGVALWGLHMGLTQGLLATLVADAAPAVLRGRAFGLFNFAIGLAQLAASLIAGLLWQAHGAPATFLTGAGLALLAGAGTFVLRRSTPAAGSKD